MRIYGAPAAPRFPDAKPGRQANFAAQVNQFVNTMAIGDIVVSPLKTLSKIGIGAVITALGLLPLLLTRRWRHTRAVMQPA